MEPGSTSRAQQFDKGLAERVRTRRLRSTDRTVTASDPPYRTQEGRTFLDFCSNDYLGLSRDRGVVDGAIRYAETHGAGATGSRLIAGGLEIHDSLERGLARFANREAALLFSSGFQANVSILPAIANRKGLIFTDRHAHHSILQGALASRAKLLRFRHNDPDHLGWLIERHGKGSRGPALIVTESIFSMDGDRAPLEAICDLADRNDALLMVDDAHAVGVWGSDGEGLAPAHPRIDLVLGTFGKAFGSSGAFVACGTSLRSHLVNFCGGFIYSTAPPPPVLGAVRAALEKITSGELRQDRFQERIRNAHDALRNAGFDTAPSDSQIVPIPMEGEDDALSCARFLHSEGILAVAIRPPTVPTGSSRLRLTINRLHTPEQISQLVAALRRYRDQARRK